MKRKRLDRDIWRDITKKRYIQKIGKLGDFDGVVGLLYVDEVIEPTMFRYDHLTFEVCANGMKWLEFIPYDENYMITSFINANGNINAWYIDMIGGYGICDDGVAYYDDLYLDIGVHPSGHIMVDDMDELEEALRDGVITNEQFDMAIATKDKLLSGKLRNPKKMSDDCLKMVEMMEADVG